MASPGKFRAILLILTLPLLFMNCIQCYPHKRAAGGLPQILQGLLTDNSTTTSGIVELLQTQNQLLGKMVASLDTLTKGLQLTAGDCSDIAAQGPYASGTYVITPWDDSGYQGAFRVYCNMETEDGGWTVVQRRFDGSTDFYRGWEDYRNGFGNVNGEYWIGLSKMNRLTSTGLSWQLRVDLEDFDNNTAYALYDNFRVGDESTSFQLSFGGYSGTAGDGLNHHANMAFSTNDRDNDLSSANCANSYKGGWWYNACHSSNLNGLYLGTSQVTATGMVWHPWKSAYETLKRSEMKIRPVNY